MSRWKRTSRLLLLAALCMPGIQTSTAINAEKTSPTSNHKEAVSSSRSSALPPTCPSRSVNYITHTLPQQCLTTTWHSQRTHTNNETTTKNSDIPPHTNTVESLEAETGIMAQDGDRASSVISKPDDTPLDRGSAPSPTPAPTAHEDGSTAAAAKPTEPDGESPLDNANFLSFEEWKRQNLAKAGQSAENIGGKAGSKPDQRKRPAPIDNALDFLGEEAEIDFDFGGFASHGPMPNPPPLRGSRLKEDADANEIPSSNDPGTREGGATRKRPKDAGRTCKERTNYASYDCAATMLKTNPECKSSSAVLVENKDTYMLNKCSAQNKFFIVELCDNILIDTVVLANFEFFSSMFRTFRVSVSDKYPVKLDKWRELGVFEGRNSREVQAFLVENPLIWARYIRVEFLTHYGKEYYCPVSLLRVHGTTMMEEFNSEMKAANDDDDSEADVVEEFSEAVGSPAKASESIRPDKSSVVTPRYHETAASTRVPSISTTTQLHQSKQVQPLSESPDVKTLRNITGCSGPWVMPAARVHTNATCAPGDAPVPNEEELADKTTTAVVPTSKTIVMTTTSLIGSDMTPTGSITSRPTTTKSVSTIPLSETKSSTTSAKADAVVKSHSPSSVPSPVAKSSSTSTQPHPPNPTTQESFFKSVHKRLQQLEANSTLSLQYIEDQSRILRDAFAAVEKRQSAKSTAFFQTLNTTVLTELLEFRKQYDQIWQSTVLELSSQREQTQHEVIALSTRLTLLADEIVFQKRMAILQFLLILLCLGLVIFSKNGHSPPYLELRPFMQNAFSSKSSVNLSKYAPLFDTPPASPSLGSRPPSRGFPTFFSSFSKRGSPSRDSQGERRDLSPSVTYSPPTPESQISDQSEGEDAVPRRDNVDGGGASHGPPEAEESLRSRSSPATPEIMKEERRQFRDGLLGPETAADP